MAMSEEVHPTKIAYIYTLSDPRDPDAVRYVGVTINPHKRLREHMSLTVKSKSHNGYWLKGLKSLGLVATWRIIDSVSNEQANEREQYWVAAYKKQGANLTNATDGGKQQFSFSEEVVAKMITNSQCNRDLFFAALTPIQRMARMAGCHTDESIAKRSISTAPSVARVWQCRTPEQKQMISAKISTSLKVYNANLTEKQKADYSKNKKGIKLKISSDAAAARSRKAWVTRRERYSAQEIHEQLRRK
jgi:predicted GIY-YIG superfamily endonuclease